MPFCKGGKDCEKCGLFRTEIRLVGLEEHQEEVKQCVFHHLADHTMNQTRMLHSLTAQYGELRNINLYQALATLADNAEARKELERLLRKNIEGVNKLIE